jgi:hypothetical protein
MNINYARSLRGDASTARNIFLIQTSSKKNRYQAGAFDLALDYITVKALRCTGVIK